MKHKFRINESTTYNHTIARDFEVVDFFKNLNIKGTKFERNGIYDVIDDYAPIIQIRKFIDYYTVSVATDNEHNSNMHFIMCQEEDAKKFYRAFPAYTPCWKIEQDGSIIRFTGLASAAFDLGSTKTIDKELSQTVDMGSEKTAVAHMIEA